MVVAVLAASTVTTRAAPADPGPPELENGPWNVLGEATGRLTGGTGGVEVSFFGRFPVEGQVDVPTEGPPVGEWTLRGGAATLVISGPGILSEAEATATGSGPVAGTKSELVLTGPVAISATATATVAGRQVSQALSETVDGIMRWRVLGEVCDQAWGEWVFTGDLPVADSDFGLELEGRWTGFRGDDFVVEELGDLLDAVSDPNASLESQAGIFGASAALISEYNRMVDDVPFAEWSVGDVIALANEAEQLLGLIAEFTECDRRLFGENNIARVVNGLTWSVQGLLIGLRSQTQPIPSSALSHLTHLGARVGAFGPGAENPANAVAAEEALRSIGQDILDANVDPDDGAVFINDDTMRVITLGAAMGWQFRLGDGSLHAAGDIYETTFGESAPPSDGGSGGGG